MQTLIFKLCVMRWEDIKWTDPGENPKDTLIGWGLNFFYLVLHCPFDKIHVEEALYAVLLKDKQGYFSAEYF